MGRVVGGRVGGWIYRWVLGKNIGRYNKWAYGWITNGASERSCYYYYKGQSNELMV